MNTLQFLLPNLDRKMLIYWNTEARKNSATDTETMFEGESYDSADFNESKEVENGKTLTRPTSHKLSVKDEYLVVLMRLRMGLSVIDLD